MGIFAKSLLDVMINEVTYLNEIELNLSALLRESLIYAINKLPVNEPFWKAADWPTTLTDRLHHGTTRPISVLDMPVCWTSPAEESDLLYEQFLDYWTLEDIDTADAKREQDKNEHRMDTLAYLAELKVSCRKWGTIWASIPCSKYCAYHPTFQCGNWKRL